MKPQQHLLSDSSATRTLVADQLESPPAGAQALRVSRFLHDGRSVLTKVVDTTKAFGEGVAEAVLEAAVSGSSDGHGQEPSRPADHRLPGCSLSWHDTDGRVLRETSVYPLELGFEDFALGRALTNLGSHGLRVELHASTSGVLESWTVERPAGQPVWSGGSSEAAAMSPRAMSPKEAREHFCAVIRNQGGKVVESSDGRLRLRVRDGKAVSSRLWAFAFLVVYGICFSLLVWIALPLLLLSSKVRSRVLSQVRAALLGEFLRYEYRLRPGDFAAVSRKHAQVQQSVSFPWQRVQALSFAPRGVEWKEPELCLRVLVEGSLQEVPIPNEAVGAALRTLLVSSMGPGPSGS